MKEPKDLKPLIRLASSAPSPKGEGFKGFPLGGEAVAQRLMRGFLSPFCYKSNKIYVELVLGLWYTVVKLCNPIGSDYQHGRKIQQAL
jgi:hypothetical protein